MWTDSSAASFESEEIIVRFTRVGSTVRDPQRFEADPQVVLLCRHDVSIFLAPSAPGWTVSGSRSE